MNSNVSEISAFLQKKLDEFNPSALMLSSGKTVSSADGVVYVEGLKDCKYGELLRFESGVFGICLDLNENGVGAVLLDKADRVKTGDRATGVGRVVEVPVGENLLSRVVDPIGRPLDAKPLKSEKYLPFERSAPTIIERKPVSVPLETGVMAVDSMIPIGRGQRELIIGDRKTGKTSLAVDTVLNQKGKDVVCVYCAIGQKAADVASIINTLKKNGADKYTVVVASTASDSPAMQYLAPYSACSIAEYFMNEGKHALIIYDDLSKHAVAYRTMSLLLHRPPGREAYPGDVFYLHSRLLERAAALSDEMGGGTLTAIPIIETVGGNISSYIPTNVISITDGQIYLESDLFNSGIRPAVNTGLSVSRVGRAAQPSAIKKVSSSLRIKFAQYREMAVFSRFNSDMDEATKKLIDDGSALTELFIQPKNAPYTLSEKVILLYFYQKGLFENVSSVFSGAKKLISFAKNGYKELMDEIDKTGEFSDISAKTAEEMFERFLSEEKNEKS